VGLVAAPARPTRAPVSKREVAGRRVSDHVTESDPALIALKSPARLARGDVLAGRYVIQAELGMGASGRVFRAHDRATRTNVALKLVRGEVTGRRGALARLGREVRHAREVQHPNVCRVFELHQSDGFTFLTMELARSSLREELARARRRSWADRLADARAIVCGLQAIHRAGVVHRDLKPENLLRLPDGRLIVSDFGLARQHGRVGASTAGTRGYVAPEVERGEVATVRSDLWSLGIVLHELFFAAGAVERTPLAAALAGLCRDCSAASPGRRPADASTVLWRLEELDGETLRERVRRGPLSVREALTIGAQVLDALADDHARGRTHGAVTPANVFLRGPDRSLRLLHPPDDPLASAEVAPAYLAPEQARREPAVDGRADVFAAGCVLVECLQGRPPGRGRAAGALARRAAGEELALGARVNPLVRPILRRMLAPNRLHRPADTRALAREMATLVTGRQALARGKPRRATRLEREQGIGAVLAIRLPAGQPIPARLLAAAEEFGATTRQVSADCLLASVQGKGTPHDLTARAARCALALKGSFPGAVLGLGIGRSAPGRVHPRGAADRARALLRGASAGDIQLDGGAAALLSAGFRVHQGQGRALLGEPSIVERPRTVLGHDVPCFGRDRELTTLLGLWRECRTEAVSRSVLLTAAAGMGKSRVRHELLDRIEASSEPFQRLLGRGDGLRAGSPFAMLAPALRTAAELQSREPPATSRDRLLDHVRAQVPGEQARRVAAFLGELADVPFPDDELPALRAAREDSRLMADQTLDAWLTYLEARCRARPLLLVLEDLHWGDAPSVQFVDAALRTLRDRPFMVLALARPEVDDTFPNLWAERDLQRIALPPLTTGSASKLVGAARPGSSAAQTSWLVQRAQGNPFYLEELIRTLASGAQTLPETIVGTLQARFESLGPDAKRVLRAASVFGSTFSAGGVRHLLGEPERDVDDCLALLVQKEVLFSRESELVFRHALVEDAAYDMLTPADRILGHRSAGAYLESLGGQDPTVLVEHYERGAAPLKAAHWCRHSAEHALHANDPGKAIEQAERGIRLGARGDTLGRLHLAVAQARFWRGEFRQAELSAARASKKLAGTARFQAIRELIAALGQQAKFSEVERLANRFRRAPRGKELPSWLDCQVWAAGYLIPGGRYETLARVMAEVQRREKRLEPTSKARLQGVQALWEWGSGRLSSAFRRMAVAAREYEALGDIRSLTEMRANEGILLAVLGAFEEAEARLTAALATAERLNLGFVTGGALANLVVVQAKLGNIALARTSAARSVALLREQGDSRFEGLAETHWAIAELLDHRPRDAEAHARAAVALVAGVETVLPQALAILAGALLAQGRLRGAALHARTAFEIMERLGRLEDGEARVRLTHARCLAAAGRKAESREVLRVARRRVLEQADAIDVPAWREGFLTRIQENAEVLAMSAALGLDAAAAPGDGSRDVRSHRPRKEHP
jgi:serine/threonine protein kinase/tetratricopeptide (TPR) repeat protein